MHPRPRLLSILTITNSVYAGLCLFFLVFQRSFLYMPMPATPAHAAVLTLDVPGATLRISHQPHAGPQALIYFGGNAEDVAFTVPALTEFFPSRASYGLHYWGYSGSTGSPSEAALRQGAQWPALSILRAAARQQPGDPARRRYRHRGSRTAGVFSLEDRV
jgi:hypothetical protein